MTLAPTITEWEAEQKVKGELDKLRAELVAVDESLGEFYVPVLDKDDQPQGSFYRDHGVHIMAEQLAATQAELDRVNGELVAVNASLDEFYIPVRDPETDEPGGAFYQDHGVHLAMEQLAATEAEIDRLRKENAALVAMLKMARKYVAMQHSEALKMVEAAR